MLLLALLLAVAPARPDTLPAKPPVEGRWKVYPGGFYHASRGVGVGVGYQVDHLGWAGSRLLVRAEPSQRRGRYSASFFTRRPEEARTFAMVRGYGETTGARYYYGIGPATARGNRLAVERRLVEAELRAGHHLMRRRLLLQPNARLVVHAGVAARERDAGARARLDTASAANLAFVLGGPPGVDTWQQGVAAGLDAVLDLRPAGRDDRGVLLTGTAWQYRGLDPGGVRFVRTTAGAYGFVPVRSGHTFALRALVALTHDQGRHAVPFYLLPTLDGTLVPGLTRYRFAASDLLALTAEYRVQVGRFLNTAALELSGTASLAGVYDDLFSQFTPRVTRAATLAPGLARYPLRPAAGLGLRAVSLERDRVYLGFTLGVSAEGWNLLSFRFVQDLRSARPSFR